MTGGGLPLLAGALAAALVLAMGLAADSVGRVPRSMARGLGEQPRTRHAFARRVLVSRSRFPGFSGPLVVGILVAVVSVASLGPAVVGTVGASTFGARVALVRSARRRRAAQLDTALPELVALLELAASAGHPVARCVEVVTDRAPSAVRPALARVRERVDRGLPLPASLEQAGPDLGVLGPALVEALVTGLVTGAPLVPALGRVGAASRDRRRRQAEEAARRLPVTLVFPLVCCVLPAFGLLAIVPLLAASFESLHP